MSSVPIFIRIVIVLLLLIVSGTGLRAQTVTSLGDWTVDGGDPTTLAGALQAVLAGTDATITLDGLGPWNDAAAWNTWKPSDTSNTYRLFQTTAELTASQTVTIELSGNTLSGAALDFITGEGKYVFENGGIGDAATNLGFGATAGATVELDDVILKALTLQIGSTTATGIVTQSGGGTTATTVNITGYDSALHFGGTAFTATDLNIGDGGAFDFSGGTVTLTHLTVSGAAYSEDDGTYARSKFSGSAGTLDSLVNSFTVDGGGLIDLSGFTYSGFTVDGGKSITVDGIYSHAEAAGSYRSELVWYGGDLSVDGGTVDITGGGRMSGVQNILVSGGTLTIQGAVDDINVGELYRSELAASGKLQIDGGTVTVADGARILGIGTGGILIDGGSLIVRGVASTSTPTRAEVATTGNLSVGAGGVLTIQTGGYVGAQAGVFDSGSELLLEGVGTDDKRAWLELASLTVDDSQITINRGALLDVAGTAVLGTTANNTTTLRLGTRSGTGGGYSASLKTGGELTVGDFGDVDVFINKGGNITSGGASILGKQADSKVTVSIGDADTTPGHYAWVAGGAAVVPGTYVPPEGDTKLEVLDGIVHVTGLFAMAGQDDLYTDGYGIARFGSAGKSAELRMAGGSFYNMNTSTFQNDSLGKIEIVSGGIVSGNGNIYAGEQFSVSGGTIAPGTRWMYHFDRGDDDKLTSLGHLHIYDRGDKNTEFHGTTYRTELDRTGLLADRTTVYGNLDFDAGFTIDISRPLDGKYLLVDTSGGTISNFTPRALSTLGTDSLLLNLNGKLLKGNNRIDYAGGMFSEWTSDNYGDDPLDTDRTEIWLTVKTTSGGNVVTYWTGEAGTAWDMTVKNFDANKAGNPGNFNGEDQFLDGDIVVFDYDYVAAGKRTVIVTTDALNYSGDMHDHGNVRVAEVNVLGGNDGTPFSWGTALEPGGSIYALDSALYTTLDQGAGLDTPSGRFNKVGSGVLEIYNSNEFYGGIHLGDDTGTGGGRIILHNNQGLGTYDSLSGYQNKGLVTVHENSTIELADPGMSITNRFIVMDGKVLTFEFPGDFTIAGNNALSGDAVQNGQGGGVFIGDGGQIVYTPIGPGGKLNINDNKASAGGGIYTKLGYTLQVPAYIADNFAQGKGGGIFAERFFQLTDGSDISGNAAQGAGGGIYVGNVGTLSDVDGQDDSEFVIHGNTTILNNMSGGKVGGGVYVDAGRNLIIDTGWSEYRNKDDELIKTFLGGDVWFEGNYAGVGFDQDNPSTGPLEMENALRNSLHLSNTASVATDDGATLTISGPYNTYFYDALSGDYGTEIFITGVLADIDTAQGPNSTYDALMIQNEQRGTTIFHADSAFYGNTTVSGGATFRLESYDKDENGASIDKFEAVYGRKASLNPDGNDTDQNIFRLNDDSTVTGHGTIAADDIYLDGFVNLDIGYFSKPDGSGASTARDGSGSIAVADEATQGTLYLDGEVSVADTGYWYLNLTNDATNTNPQTDRIAVTGSASFSGAAGEKLTLDLDKILRGKYAVMTTTGGITGYNTDKKKSDAEVFLLSDDTLNLVTQTPLDDSGDSIFKRLNVTTYVENKNLYLDVGARNRHVMNDGNAGGNWGHNSTWAFDASYDIDNVSGSLVWMKNDDGPATTAYVDGDMVTFTGGNYALTTNVKPVDLFVTGNVSIGGGYGITTFATDATSGTTILSTKDTTGTNDYNIAKYTGMLYKTGDGTTLTFTNTGGNTFTHGIAIGDADDGGTIRFSDGNQLRVGDGADMRFLNDGTLNATATTELATAIRINSGKTAFFDVENGVTLTQSGVIFDDSTLGAIEKTGTGTLYVTGENDFTGGTTFERGKLQIGNDTAFGAYSSTPALTTTAGLINVTDTHDEKKTFVVNDDATVANRFDVVGNNGTGGLLIDLADGKTFTMSGYTTTSTGGAINVQGGTTQLSFDATTGSLVVRDNTASSGGGIYTLATGTLTFTPTTTLSGNTATTGDGGALHAAGDVVLSGGLTMTDNTAESGDGGGIYAQSISLTGPATISGNSANATSGQGGAFYVNGGTLSLSTGTAGNITFSGNTASTDGGQAVYLADNADVTIAGAGNVLFYDTLVSTATGHEFTMNGTGTVMFAGTGAETNNNIFIGTTNVNAGTFRITTGTQYGSTVAVGGVGDEFVLAHGATLTGGGTINLGTGDSFGHLGILAPDDSTGLTVSAADLAAKKHIGTLTVNGDYNVTGTVNILDYQFDFDLDGVSGATERKTGDADLLTVEGTFTAKAGAQIVFNLHNYTAGKYLLIEAGTLDVSAFKDGSNEVVDGINNPNGAFNVTIHDFEKTDRHRVSFMRGDELVYSTSDPTDFAYANDALDAYVKDYDGPDLENDQDYIDLKAKATNELWLATRYNNLYTYWTGGGDGPGANDVWQGDDNELNGNWLDVKPNPDDSAPAGQEYLSSGETHFENNDSVAFVDSFEYYDSGSKTITPANKAIKLGSDVTVTDMLVDTTGTYSFEGDFGITTSIKYSGDVLDSRYSGGSESDDVPQTLTKKGAGTLTFTNTGGNTFAGGIVFDTTPGNDAGTIIFDLADQLGDDGKGITFTENGTLRSDDDIVSLTNNFHIANGKTATFDTNGFSVIYTGKIDEINSGDTGNFIKTGNGVLRLSNGLNAWQGTTTISGGTLQANGVDSLGPWQNSVTSTTRTITNNASLEVDIASGSETLAQIIEGTGSVIKSGTGTLRLNQVNEYTGNTLINSTGTLIAQGVAALGDDAAGKQVSSTTGGTLNLEIAADETLLQRLTGSGMNVTKSGAGTLTINRVNDYIGTTNIDAGKVLITNVAGLGDNATARTVTMASNTELEISLTAAGTFNKQLLGAGALTKTGAGVLTLTNTNTFTGGTDLNAGTITLGNNTALGSYLYAGATPQNGQVNLNADGTTVMNTAARTIQNRFVVADGLDTGATDGANITAENSLTVQNVNSSVAGVDGGAIHVGTGSKLTLTAGSATAGQDITFTGNVDQAGANDIFMDTGAVLDLAGARNIFIGSGIRGTGTVSKTGSGIVQIAENSAFSGTTDIDAGTFRVVGGKTYGTETSVFNLDTGTTLSGQGTIKGATVTLNGLISPDAVTMASGSPVPGTSLATMTISGDTVLDGFTMDYDLPASAGSHGDLLKLEDGTSYSLVGGTINFRGTLNTGRYLVVDADDTISISGAPTKLLDGINDTTDGVLKATLNGTALTNTTPRYGLAFLFDNVGQDAASSEIWLDVEVNTLTMDWTNTDSEATWNSAASNWESRQWATAPGTSGLATVFRDGDYVHFTGNHASGQTITIAADVVVSGMTFSGANSIIFTGAGITGRKQTSPTDSDITGKFIDPGQGIYDDPVVTPDGKLTKSGTGILTFQNTGNTFNEGIELGTATTAGGTIRFNNGNQLQVGSGKQISVLNTGTLYYNGAGNGELETAIDIDGTDGALTYTVVNTVTLTQSGLVTGSGAFTKTGGTAAGSVLDLTNQGNTFSGDITVAHGTLASLNVAALGSNINTREINLQNTDSILNVRQTVTTGNELNQLLTGTGKVTKSGDENLILTHEDNTYGGGTTVAAGTLTAKHAWVDGTHRGSIGTGPVTLTLATSVLDFNILEDGSFAGAIGGLGKVELNADKELTLSAVSGYTGETNINDGKIVITNVAAVGNNAAAGIVNIADGSALEINAAGTFSKSLRGAGSLIKSGTASLTLDTDNSAANAFTGGTTMSGGGLTLGNVGALNTYTNAGGTKGLVTLTGTGEKTVTLGADGTYRNRFDVTAGTFTLTNGAGNANTIGIGASSNTNGGAIALGSGTTMNLNNAGSLTFTGNQDMSGGNDVYMDSATLDIVGAGNAFFGGGIRGAGTVTKTGSGLTQIGANSSIDGSTTINSATGRFRVNGTGTTYENTGVGHAFTLTAGILEGNGTVAAPTVTINGTISPDNDTLSATHSTVTTTEDARFGTLTLSGAVTLDGFTMLYDPTTGTPPKTIDSSITSTGDLLRIAGTDSPLLKGGTIRFTADELTSGYYLIVDSAVKIDLEAGKTLDKINNTGTGVLAASLNGTALTTLSPRAYYHFEFAKNAANVDDSQIWLGVDRNTLIMDWNTGVSGTWNSSAENWTSLQYNLDNVTEIHEKKFNNGDYVRFTNANTITPNTITIGSEVFVSGMTVGGVGNTTFTGTSGSIHAIKTNPTDETYIEGKYLPDGTTPATWQVIPDGMLKKSGSGTLTFQNAGGNMFDGGIEISAGTVAFNLANQLETGTDGITFDGAVGDKATLQANGSAVLENNVTVKTNKVGTIDVVSASHALTFNTGTVEIEDGGTLNLIGSGNQFYNTGILGTAATLAKSGAGIVQIGETSVLNGDTDIDAGTFRVVVDKRYGGTGTFDLASAATLAGGGTIQADTITIAGTISPDGKIMTASDVDEPDGTEKYETLTLSGIVTLAGSFQMQYDAHNPNNSVTPTGDLLVVQNGTLTIEAGGIVNLRNNEGLTGSYHIIDADDTITLGGTDIGNTLTATINDHTLDNYSVRGGYTFEMRESKTEVWLNVTHNSLNMVWQDDADRDDNVWTATGNKENWLSNQGGASPLQQKEKVFNNGDYVHFTDVGNGGGTQTIQIVGRVDTAGFEFDSTGTYTFTGSGGILADKFLTSIEGIYKNVSLIPDGILNKKGAGILEFKNTGGNTFVQGIEITAGTIGFTRADQLQTWETDAATDDTGIRFLGDGTLRADATNQNLGNKIMIETGKTATIDTQDHHLTISGVVSGNAVKKTGDGRLTLTGTNIYTGLTTVSEGTLEAVGVAALGVNGSANEVTIAQDAELEVNIGTGSDILNKLLTGDGMLEKTGDGELVLSQTDNTYSGGTIVTTGPLTVQHVEQGGNNGGLGTGGTEIASGAVLNFNILENGAYSQRISGAGKVEKNGANTLTLTNTTSGYTGGTEIKDGRIVATHENALGANVDTGIVDMSGIGTFLEFQLPTDPTFNQKITGLGTLVQTGPGTLALSHANDFSGGTQWNGGDIRLTNNAGLAATNGTGVAGFVYVNTDGTLSTDTADDTLQNRFAIAADKTMTIDNELTISNNNVAGVDGGAIVLNSDASFTSNDPLHLIGNTATGDGGAVYAPTEHVTVGGTGDNTVATLTGNSARDGGAVYARSVSIIGQDGGSTISGNTATRDGGAFHLVGGTAGNNAVSELDASLGSITFQDNTAGGVSNAIHLNENVTLDIKSDFVAGKKRNIYLDDGISSKAYAANGNMINIDLPYWTESDPINMNDSALIVAGISDYYGDTNLNGGLMVLEKNSQFGTIAPDNTFTQYSNGTLAGYGTVSAKEILLGGTINAGVYTPPPRDHEIATLNFEGTTTLGTLTGIGQTVMNVDIDTAAAQTADLMDVTGDVVISGTSHVDFNTFSIGKYLLVRTDGIVDKYTADGTYNGQTKITDFTSTIAGIALNPYRFAITYTVEDSDGKIYANMDVNNEYIVWTGANDYDPTFSGSWPYHHPENDPDHDYDNKWLNNPLYNWHQVKRDADGTITSDYIVRFRQGDKVAFIANDPVEIDQPNYLETRKNIVIVTNTADDTSGSGDSVAHVADMLVTGNGIYRFTGRGIYSSIDLDITNYEGAAGQLYIDGHATAIFANEANNFQRGIVLQDGAVGFNDPDQLNTIFENDIYNNGDTASHGIKVEGENSYGILYANSDKMTLGIVINIDDATSEMVINTDGNDFGDDTVEGNYTLTLTHAETPGHTEGDNPTPVNGIYGQGTLVKAGNGTLILARENTYEGGTVVEKGTLAVADDDRLGKEGTAILLGKTINPSNPPDPVDRSGGTLRALETFGTDRTILISENGGAIEADKDKIFTLDGVLTDYAPLERGIGTLSKTGEGTVVATNTDNNFRGDLYVEKGRFVAANVDTLGYNDSSRVLYTAKSGDVRSVLELQVASEQTLAQKLGGDGEVLKSGGGQLNLDVDSPSFEGFLNVAAGSIYLTGDFGNGDSFRFADGTTLSGYGKLGGQTGGVFESGSILAPGNVVADDPNTNPTSESIYVDGSVTFAAGSLYQVVITQYPDENYDPERMRPVSDCLDVKNGTVTIESGALLEVELDYWSDNLIPFDFGEDSSGSWTIIDADDGAANNGTFTISDVELPRGVEIDHGWIGSLYQLWLIGNPTGVFTEITDSHNTLEVATELEELVKSKDPGTKDLIKILSQKDIDDETLLDIMRQLAGDLRADSMAMALKMPWRQPFNRLDRDMFPYVPDPCDPITCRRKYHYRRQFWGEAYGRYTDTDSDGNAYGNHITRAGTAIGMDKQLNTFSLVGAALNYSEPRMKQHTGRVEMEDFEIGLYNLTKIAGYYDLKTYLGYSHQRYDLRRHVFIPEGNRYDALLESFKNKTSGDGFAMSFELLRSFRCHDRIKLTPLLALDYEKVWQHGYTETPVGTGTAMTALRYENASLERLMMRVGLDVKAEVRDLLDLFVRVQYATQLNGTQYARSNTYLAAAQDPSVMDIHGVNIGRDYLNIGVGAEYFFKGTKRATSMYLNYDADIWKRQTTHTGNLGFVHRW